jgi:hypothetical protein
MFSWASGKPIFSGSTGKSEGPSLLQILLIDHLVISLLLEVGCLQQKLAGTMTITPESNKNQLGRFLD